MSALDLKRMLSPLDTKQPRAVDFASPDADIVLSTADGQTFRTYALILRETSGFFRGTLSHPQSPITSPGVVMTLHLDEKADTISALLSVITGKEFPDLDSFETIEPFVEAADKYEMPGPKSLVRRLITTYPFMNDPLRVYAIACRYGWEKEASLASRHSLAYDITDPSVTPSFRGMDWNHLLRLFHLHRARREGLQRDMEDSEKYPTPGLKCECGKDMDVSSWRSLKLRITSELSKNPLGSVITSGAFTDWPEAIAVRDAECTCGDPLFNFGSLVADLQTGVESLPKSIDEVSRSGIHRMTSTVDC
jgi:hypothetical protein